MDYQSAFSDSMIDELYHGILTLKSIEECYRFFEDICTIKELQSISLRLKVARMLDEHVRYCKIEEKTGASTATISRISKCLQRGTRGYNIVLDRMNENHYGMREKKLR